MLPTGFYVIVLEVGPSFEVRSQTCHERHIFSSFLFANPSVRPFVRIENLTDPKGF